MFSTHRETQTLTHIVCGSTVVDYDTYEAFITFVLRYKVHIQEYRNVK